MEGICAYTCPMERAADKTLMGFACLALAALSGEVPVQTVTALLLAVCASAAYELICGRVPRETMINGPIPPQGLSGDGFPMGWAGPVKWTLDSAQPLGDELGSVFHGGEPV